MKDFKIVLSEEQIKNRVKELGQRITADYQGKKPIVVCMLKGAILFFSDLIRQLDLPLTIEFARLSSYKNGVSSGDIEIIDTIKTDIAGKDVLIVEDVVDSGKTLAFFKNMLLKQNPASVKICALLDKPEKRKTQVDVDYTGFTLGDKFVIGYGLDYAERFRELPFLAAVDSEEEAKSKL